jgi:hypothetical protein
VASRFVTRLLRAGEEADLAALETAAWPAPLQASVDKIAKRIELGHRIMVVDRDGELTASVCYVPTADDPFDRSTFPKTFEAFSSLPRSEPSRCVYVYNLCVHPGHRDGAVVRDVMRAGILDSISLGTRYLVADGRCPAYAGSAGLPDRVDADDTFRKTIDDWRASGTKPDDDELLRDPVLRFYRRLLDCRFLYLIPDFIPEDIASGGHRVIFIADLTKVKLADDPGRNSL